VLHKRYIKEDQALYIYKRENMRRIRTTIRQDLIQIRRDKVLEYLSTGHSSHREIASKLHVSHDTVDRDARYLVQDCKEDIRKHFESLPLEIKKCMIGLELTIKAFTSIIESEATEPVHRLSALTARMQAYRFKVDILDGKAQLDEVFAFIDEEKKQQQQNQDRVRLNKRAKKP
jgi:hypothetical protein